MYIVSKQLFAKQFADQFFLLLEFLKAGTVSDSSLHVHEIRSLHSGWSVVALWRGWQSYACLGSSPHALGCWSDQGW
jgi:hypothetical protein